MIFTYSGLVSAITPVHQPLQIMVKVNLKLNFHSQKVFFLTEFKMSSDECRKQFNSSTVLRLNALNNYHQPPGITVYNSGKSKLAY